LRAKGTPEAAELAAAAEHGMRIIDRETQVLTPPDDTELKQLYARLHELHGQAFGWQPSDVIGLERLGSYPDAAVRAGLDQRMGPGTTRPGYRPGTEVFDVASNYREDADLESI
jgi:hypothetical protein